MKNFGHQSYTNITVIMLPNHPIFPLPVLHNGLYSDSILAALKFDISLSFFNLEYLQKQVGILSNPYYANYDPLLTCSKNFIICSL